MRAVVDTMNQAAFETMNKIYQPYANYFNRGPIRHWLGRKVNYARPIPDCHEEKIEYHWFARLPGDDTHKWVWRVPPNWDGNLVDSRFFYMTIKNGKVIFGRFLD